jgi:membrane-bound serine protease (ClpP class)
MKERPVLALSAVIAAAFLLLSIVDPAFCDEPEPSRAAGTSVVAVVPAEGVIGIAFEEHIRESMAGAKEQGAVIMVLVMDTPGGLSSSMREIIQLIQSAPFPVAAWISPQGARGASAGAFIVQASHIAAMAPGTNMGAAHPVVALGGDIPDTDMKKKVVSDFAAQMRSLAGLRGRDIAAAEKMVTESVSYTSSEALDARVIDLVVGDIDGILAWAEGRTFLVGEEEQKFSLQGYRVVELGMDPRLKALQIISRPDTAYLLLVAGVFAIILEVLSPGGFVLGVTGGILMLFGAYGLRMIPFNWAGIVFLLAGVAVMVLDLLVGGIGFLSVPGAGAIIVGGLILFRAPGGELLNMSYSFMTGAVAVLAAFFLFAAWAVWRSLRSQPVSGRDALVGSRALAVSDLSPQGTVICHGEIWKARLSGDGSLESGAAAVVEEVDGLTLIVRPLAAGEEAPSQ